MPELPEVEVVVAGLKPHIINQTITNVAVSEKRLRLPYPENFFETLMGATITNLERRAKYIIAHLSNNHHAIIHLGMSGKLLLTENVKQSPHNHVIIELGLGPKLVFNDPRRFGLFINCSDEEAENHPLFKNLGPEPLTDEFSATYLLNALKTRSIAIKAALMNNSVVVGVGNIYASESLFRARISPLRPANQLTHKEITRLIPHIQDVLREAIASGGSTLRDFVRSSGDSGYFQHNFAVYGKSGDPCHSCTTPIKSKIIAGRNTFYCPKCQAK